MVTVVNDDDIRIEKLTLGPYETNAYIIVCGGTGESLVADAPADASEIIDALNGTQPRYILLTHDHYDHTGALDTLRSELRVPLATHARSSRQLTTPPEIMLNDGDSLMLGELEIDVIHTPGHTPGGLCFKTGKYLLAGDTVFPGGPGHTGSPTDFTQLLKSITEKIYTLPDNTVILPGHGDDTTVKKSRDEYAVFASRTHPDDLCGDVLWASA